MDTLRPTPSDEITATPEKLSFQPITSDDQAWLCELGCEWPVEEVDSWLDELNEQVVLGNTNLSHIYDEDLKTAVFNARSAFLDRLPVLSQQDKQRHGDHNNRFMPLGTVIDTQRLFYEKGINLRQAIRYRSRLFDSSADTLRTNIEHLEQLGIDIPRATKVQPSIIGLTPDSVDERLRNLASLGFDPIATVNKRGGILSYSTDKVAASVGYLQSVGVSSDKIKPNNLRIFEIALTTLQARVKTLEGFGVNISQATSANCNILSISEKSIKKRFEALQARGFDMNTVTKHAPQALACSNKVVNSKLNYLRKLGIEDPVAVINRNLSILGYSTKTMQGRLDYLESLGIAPTTAIKNNARLLGFDPDTLESNRQDLEKEGIGHGAVRIFSGILTHKPATVRTKLAAIDKLGLDARVVINKQPGLLGANPERLRRNLRTLCAIGRTAGWENYRAEVIKIVEDNPSILASKPEKIKTLARIAFRLFEPMSPGKEAATLAKRMDRMVLERVVTSYLEEKDAIDTPNDLRVAVNQQPKDKKELRKVIATHSDDPIVRSYERGYSLAA